MGEDEPRVAPAGGDTLQLDTAEPLDPAVPAAKVCRACGERIERTYFTIGASIACGGCRDAFVHRLASLVDLPRVQKVGERPPRLGLLARPVSKRGVGQKGRDCAVCPPERVRVGAIERGMRCL